MVSIGTVSIDLHKKERDFMKLSLSDPNVVKWLILYRDKIDIYFGSTTDNFYDNAGDIKEINQELINTYICLEELIESTELKTEQRALLDLLFIGFSYDDISQHIKETTSPQGIERRFNTICKKISEQDYTNWVMWINSKVINTKWKECTKCKKYFPMRTYFFGRDSRNKSGFKSRCRKCV